ncbi:MAG: class I SAM-dependent methyltransferase [Gemmatimonadetes bacterium]|nr:class I SAM-dependent methyltransferase [Gemmatimonadota bacterium]
MIRAARPIETAQIARHYDVLDPFYRALWGEHLHHGLWETGRETPQEAVRLLVHAVARHAAITRGASVCDVGCGYGAPARLLATEYGASVSGYTLSAVQLERAKTHAAADVRLRFTLNDWLTAGLPDHAFDAVIAIESTEHMADKPQFFREAARVLRPGGRLVVCAWLAADSPRPWQHRLLLEPICTEGRLPSMGTAEEYRSWINAAGLTLIAFEDLTARVRRTWTLATRRILRHLLLEPGSWRFLLDRRTSDRVFARTVLRILLAYRTGCMRYGMFTASR